MKEKYWIYFIISVLIYGISLYLWWDSDNNREMILVSLTVLICLASDLLISVIRRFSGLHYIITAIMLGVAIYGFGINIVVFAAIPILKLTSELWGVRYGILFTASLVFMACLIYQPPHIVIILVFSELPTVFLVIYILDGWKQSREKFEQKNDELNALRNRVNKQRTFAKTAEYAAGLRERNRLATRIHDKLGHGISGNILLLEGASLLMDKDPIKSKETIDQVAQNLREGVDDIRASLRDERTSMDIIGLSEIKKELYKLSANYTDIDTSLRTEGDIDEIPPVIWVCIFENLKETIANLIKHSNATKFSILITNNNKLARIEFKDNGDVKDFKADIGLNSMEERCAVLGGRCFFSIDGGFTTVMIFRDMK